MSILSQKLKPDLKNLWDFYLERDASRSCYYKSGLNLLVSDIKRLSKEWKVKNGENLNPFYHFDKKTKNIRRIAIQKMTFAVSCLFPLAICFLLIKF